MATQGIPRPDDIPQRPRLTVESLAGLMANPDPIPAAYAYKAEAAHEWLTKMRTWAAWAIEYCKRLDAVYVEHQAIAHDRRVEPGALADAVSMYGGMERCKICAYLHEQHEANRL